MVTPAEPWGLGGGREEAGRGLRGQGLGGGWEGAVGPGAPLSIWEVPRQGGSVLVISVLHSQLKPVPNEPLLSGKTPSGRSPWIGTPFVKLLRVGFSFRLDFPKYLTVTQFSFPSLEVIPPSPLSVEMAAVAGAGCPWPAQRGIHDGRASAVAHPAAPRSPCTPSHRQGHLLPCTLPYSFPPAPPSPGGSPSGKERETSFPRSLTDPWVGLLRMLQRGLGARLRFLTTGCSCLVSPGAGRWVVEPASRGSVPEQG